MFRWFYGHEPKFEWTEKQVRQRSTADLVELFKQNMDDPGRAERELVA